VEGTAARKAVGEMSGEERWAVFLWYGADRSRRELVNAILEHEEAIAMAGETMLAFTKEEIAWFRRESEIKYELDMRQREIDIENAVRERILKEEREKALRGKLESARKMKARGDSNEEIADILSLPVKDVAEI
jgi:hypothetical protein